MSFTLLKFSIFMNITLHSLALLLTSALSFSVVWSFFIWVICQLSSFCLYFGVLFKCYVSWPLEVMASWSLLFPGNCRFRACLLSVLPMPAVGSWLPFPSVWSSAEAPFACCGQCVVFSWLRHILMWVGLHVKRPACHCHLGM